MIPHFAHERVNIGQGRNGWPGLSGLSALSGLLGRLPAVSPGRGQKSQKQTGELDYAE
jgi:hypothetical protein